jgi:anti-sigma factor (TIGR02949 family)
MEWKSRLRRILSRQTVTCTEVLEALQSYLDGETDPGSARQLVGHLDHCSHCERERQLYTGIKRALSARRGAVDPQIMAALSTYGERLARGELT